MRLEITVVCAVLLVIVGCSPQNNPQLATTEPEPQPQPTPSYSNEKYVPDGHIRQVLDVYLPVGGSPPYPTILAFHGGGFRARSKNLYAPYAHHFTEQGYALVTANYRFVPAFSYPAQVEDAFCALAWIHAKAAEFGFDSDRVIVMGDSAGGYLAAMLGTVDTPGLYQGECPHEVPQPPSMKGSVILYGLFDLTSMEGYQPSDIKNGLEPLMGGSFDEMPQDKLEEMSPISWIDGSEQPFLLIHGTEDESVAYLISENFQKALEAHGARASLILVEADHAFFLNRTSEHVTISLEVIDEFIAELVGK